MNDKETMWIIETSKVYSSYMIDHEVIHSIADVGSYFMNPVVN